MSRTNPKLVERGQIIRVDFRYAWCPNSRSKISTGTAFAEQSEKLIEPSTKNNCLETGSLPTIFERRFPPRRFARYIHVGQPMKVQLVSIPTESDPLDGAYYLPSDGPVSYTHLTLPTKRIV